MSSEGEDLGEDVSEVVGARDEHELDDLGRNLFAQPSHLDAEVPVATGDYMVGHHSDAGLIVFVQFGRGKLWEP